MKITLRNLTYSLIVQHLDPEKFSWKVCKETDFSPFVREFAAFWQNYALQIIRKYEVFHGLLFIIIKKFSGCCRILSCNFCMAEVISLNSFWNKISIVFCFRDSHLQCEQQLRHRCKCSLFSLPVRVRRTQQLCSGCRIWENDDRIPHFTGNTFRNSLRTNQLPIS